MHVGHTAIFQNPNQTVSDYQIYQEDMAIAKECADLGCQSVWGIEHHFTDYIMNPNITQFLSYMAGYNSKIKVGSMVVVMPWYPEQCYDRIKYIYDQSHCCGSINAFKFGGMPYEDARASMRLFAKEVMPELRKLGPDPLFDTEAAVPPAFQAA